MTDLFIPMPVTPIQGAEGWCQGTDEHGVTWEFRYVIPMSTPEYLEFRHQGEQLWQELPGWALPPIEVMEFFHGELEQGEPSDDSKALDELAEFMSGREWDADATQVIADLIRGTGRSIEDVND